MKCAKCKKQFRCVSEGVYIPEITRGLLRTEQRLVWFCDDCAVVKLKDFLKANNIHTKKVDNRG